MRAPTKLIAIITVVVGAVSMSSVLHAQSPDDRNAKGGMMEMGPGMMNMMGQMGHMMDQCSRMMQRTSAKPNEQEKASPGATGEGTKQP